MSAFTEEMRELLRSRGYNPADAARLEEEGMGPHELEHILKTTRPGERGSLEYTRGIKKMSNLGTYKDISKLPMALDKNSRGQWHEEQWREPDVWVPGDYSSTAIWYGPGGPEGDDATMVEGEGSSFTVTEWHNPAGEIDDPDDNYLVQSVTLDAEEVINELRLAKIKSKGRDLKGLFRWVAGIGVAHLAYYGGEESWEDELPR